MITIFIRYLFTCACSIYSYICFIQYTRNNLAKLYIPLKFSLLISLIIAILPNTNASHRIIIAIALTYILLTIFTHTAPIKSIIYILVSFGLSYVFLCISGSIIGTIYVLIYKRADSIPYTLTHFPTGLLQTVLLLCIFKIKRFKNGIITIIKGNISSVGILISLTFVIFFSLISTKQSSSFSLQFIITMLALTLSFLLLLYWRHRITKTYREKLRQANEKSMLDEIAEHKATIDKLKADNKRLASIVHADNKLVPAMLTAVTSHLENSDNLTLEDLTMRGQELSEQLRDMANNRQGILDSSSEESMQLPKSGLHTVDGMLSFMETRAKECDITYKVVLDDTIKETALQALNEEDLLRLLGDLIDNAIIAVKHSDKEKAIMIHMGILQNHFLVEISDSGIPFSIETYQHFGNEQHTTHKDTGGSGIGLMDIWKIKKKYKASLHIYEFPEHHGIYSKKISFVFDRKNHFLLQTNRYKEIARELTRGDLYIFPHKSESN